MDHLQKNDKTEKATELLGRKKQERRGKGNQMEALRFQTGGETLRISPASLRGHVSDTGLILQSRVM